jgi:hypothetical protein
MRFWNNHNQLHSKSKYFKPAFELKKEANRMVGYPTFNVAFVLQTNWKIPNSTEK